MDYLERYLKDLDPDENGRIITNMLDIEKGTRAVFNGFELHVQAKVMAIEESLHAEFGKHMDGITREEVAMDKRIAEVDKAQKQMKARLLETSTLIENRCADVIVGSINRLENESAIAQQVLQDMTNKAVENFREASADIERVTLGAMRNASSASVIVSSGVRGRPRSISRESLGFRANQALVVRRAASRSLSASSRSCIEEDVADAQRVARMRSPPPLANTLSMRILSRGESLHDC
jgi:hypothetical protein